MQPLLTPAQFSMGIAIATFATVAVFAMFLAGYLDGANVVKYPLLENTFASRMIVWIALVYLFFLFTSIAVGLLGSFLRNLLGVFY